MEFKPLNKVWIKSGQSVYPGIVLSIDGQKYIVLKFDTAIWRRIICSAEELSHRKQDFSKHMFTVRKNFISV